MIMVVDGITLDFLKRNSSQQDFGKERLFGAVSWAVTHLVMGPILDRYQDFVAFYFFGIAAAVVMVVSINLYSSGDTSPLETIEGLRRQDVKRHASDIASSNDDFEDITGQLIAKQKHHNEQPSNNKPSCLSLFALFGASCYSVSFLIARVTLASGQAVVDKLVFLFFEFLGSSYTLMSLTVVLTVMFEIPIFHVAPKILHHIGSSGMLLLASFSYVTRVIGYTLIPSGKTPLVLLFEPLHGVTYACAKTSSVEFASKLIDEPGLEASGQGFLQFFVGGGSALGLAYGGWMEDTHGPHLMYRISAAVVLIGNSIFVGQLFLRSRCHDLQFNTWKNRTHHHAIEQEETDNVLEMTASPTVSSSEAK
jgi:Na+/melibiose symporter-like transporter